MKQALKEILGAFIRSGWTLISQPSREWMDGRGTKQALADALEQAQQECGNCGCDLDPLYPRALDLLKSEPNGYRYEKLVRDRIPEMIEKQGFTPKTRVLDEEEYLSELNRKLQEEIAEYLESEEMEEIADILEVLEAICAVRGYSPEKLAQCKQKKREERGGFEKRLYLISKE